ncbi:Methyltransferase domain-containing protein [Cohaesibacter sp. ES.047]|uniref:class I SAM-dependent methyltransferase n=1 Tax=Cohaesibacter sp. ES.047 TaxID=1798205 RepID=UPI000BB7A70F|nr:methyltransferase domain-containing protein [Cohaesibacter sp. ES.047]SNY94282.1 Methyltransferase domain-containing protein [Cohaesibacter sp. ES.047]
MALISLEDNRENWQDETLLQKDRWLPRAKRACMFVRPGERVLDLGCGYQLSRPFLEPACSYTPCDISQRTPDTIVCDLNNGEFPEGQFDAVLVLGVWEYTPNIDFILDKLRQQAKKVIFSYCMSNDTSEQMIQQRTKFRWLTHWNASELDNMFKRHQFKLVHAEVIDKSKHFDQILGVLANMEKATESK